MAVLPARSAAPAVPASTGRPYVLLSCATSIDGYIDDASDQRLLLSNDDDLDRVDAVRASCDAILVGAGTVRRDDPRLLVRSADRRAERVACGRPASPTKVMLGNCNTLCRIDVGGLFDGGFSEGAALNAVAWLGLRRPTILWTYALDALGAAALDAYFQQHALMRVFPMAPMPGNDHSIQPGSPLVQQYYQDYAPVFAALRGCEWVLDAARPVRATSGTANVFRARGTSTDAAQPGQLLAVVALGDVSADSVSIEVTGAALFGSATAVRADTLVPGADAWLPLGTLSVVDGAVDAAGVPMLRGCALLRLVPVTSTPT